MKALLWIVGIWLACGLFPFCYRIRMIFKYNQEEVLLGVWHAFLLLLLGALSCIYTLAMLYGGYDGND